jgi:hypothetical protein
MKDRNRPDGAKMIKWGPRVVVFGVLAALFSRFFEPFHFVDNPPLETAKLFWLQTLSVVTMTMGITLIPFGFLAWLAGKIIFALSFLPQRDETNAPNN